MPSPFPGMNPYLEGYLWSDVHNAFANKIRQMLVPKLRPRYTARLEIYLVEDPAPETEIGILYPDVEILQIKQTQSINLPLNNSAAIATTPAALKLPVLQPVEVRIPTIEIRDTAKNVLVTCIEILSPVNKRPGKGRETYEAKRQNVLGSFTHLVEIDLLRQWEPMPILEQNIQSNYRILVSRGDRRPLADLYAFNLQDIIPSFPLLLLSGDVEPIVDLKALLDLVYDRAVYRLQINYNSEPVPALTEAEATWADALLKEQSLRAT